MISVRLQGKIIQYHIIQAYAPTSNAEEAEVQWFCEDPQDLLELTPKKVVLFIIGDWNAKIGSQETPEVTGKFGLGVRNEAGQRLIEFCHENTLVIANRIDYKLQILVFELLPKQVLFSLLKSVRHVKPLSPLP